jgi:hypothetical protein
VAQSGRFRSDDKDNRERVSTDRKLLLTLVRFSAKTMLSIGKALAEAVLELRGEKK